MFVQKYYVEIKSRLFLIFLSWVFAVLACSIYKEILLFFVIKSTSPVISLSKNYVKLYFIITDVKELFNVYFKLIFFVTNQLCTIIFFYQMFMFFYLGLYIKEYNKIKVVSKFLIIFFIFAILVSYFYIVPFSWYFFLSFQYKINNIQLFPFFFEAKISEYFDFVIQIYNTSLWSFQFIGIALFMLNNLFVEIKHKKIKLFRKFCYFLFFLFSTIITPPDLVSQVVVSFFLILIYEMFIFVKIFYSLNKESKKVNWVTN